MSYSIISITKYSSLCIKCLASFCCIKYNVPLCFPMCLTIQILFDDVNLIDILQEPTFLNRIQISLIKDYQKY